MLRVLVDQHEVDISSKEITSDFDQQILTSLLFKLHVLIEDDLEFVIIAAGCSDWSFKDCWLKALVTLDEEILDVNIILFSVVGVGGSLRFLGIELVSFVEGHLELN